MGGGRGSEANETSESRRLHLPSIGTATSRSARASAKERSQAVAEPTAPAEIGQWEALGLDK